MPKSDKFLPEQRLARYFTPCGSFGFIAMKPICLVILFMTNLLPAQKWVKKSIINPEIAAINIDATNNFELSVDTAPGNEMILEATLEGEYSKNLVLNVREAGNTLLVSTDFSPDFKKPGDKLSAHKVISVALKIVLPEQKRIRIFGAGCHISVQGSYHDLKIMLNDGTCVLEHVSGDVEVATQSGTISVATARADIDARTKYGEVRGDWIPTGENRYDLSSVTGNILLNKTD